MANGDTPDLRDVWDAVNQSRMELAELKGMIKIHLEAGQHHYPPCKPAADLQKTMLSAMGAAVLALIAAIGNIVMEFIRR
ncbi:MAG: hypothetical protein BWY31_03482 [Lentisphaerae bacterium ADurb.Bin242]|nr:MAG: hypothetical protein BWY31_03482 [Lentisphaerae bacterium ADurb.Bin242]